MTTAPLPNAGVRFPPPIIFLLGLALGYGLNRVVPLWLASPEPRWMFRLGIQLAIAGFLFALSGILTFRRHGTAIIPHHPASTIVTSGPYRFTRNPMYIGMSVFYSRGALLFDTWWAFALLPVVVAIIDRQVIAREERYLASAFGAEYDSYRSRVRRWI